MDLENRTRDHIVLRSTGFDIRGQWNTIIIVHQGTSEYSESVSALLNLTFWSVEKHSLTATVNQHTEVKFLVKHENGGIIIPFA